MLRKNKILTLSLSFLAIAVLLIFLFPTAFYNHIEILSLKIRSVFGRYYLYLGLFCVLFLVLIAISPLGKINLGAKGDKPEFSCWAWLAMLYSAGMGAGILLRAVQEPVFMFVNPPINTGASAQIVALEYTFYQWGFTAWAFYALFGLIIGYYLFVKNKSILISESLRRSTGNKYVLKIVDILVIFTTIFGLVAAVGLGTSQINGGLNHLFHYNFSENSTIVLVIIISVLAFISVWKGVNKGIKLISTANIFATILLLFFVLIQSDILQVLQSFLLASYHYIIDFIPLSLALGKYNPGEDFLSDWTYYYWAFWLAWAPFTGVFIARISKGRSIRELIFAVLLIPSLGTFFWFSTFANEAFAFISNMGQYSGEFGNVFTSIFVFFENYTANSFINSGVLLLLIGFLVTSVDSAVYVLSMFSEKGRQNPSKRMRLIWSLTIAVCTIAIVILGNSKPEINLLTAMQKLLIISSLPFAILVPILCFTFMRDVIFTKDEN